MNNFQRSNAPSATSRGGSLFQPGMELDDEGFLDDDGGFEVTDTRSVSSGI